MDTGRAAQPQLADRRHIEEARRLEEEEGGGAARAAEEGASGKRAGARGAPHHLTLSDQIFDVWRGRPSKRGQAPELQRLNAAEEAAAVNC